MSIQDFGASAGVNRYRLINWTTIGTSTNFTTRVGTNTTYARSSLPTLIDFTAVYGANENDITDPYTSGIYQGMRVEGFNLWTGQSIWNSTIDSARYSGSCNIADHGKVAVLDQQGRFWAFDLANGKLAWKSEQMTYPWGAPELLGHMQYNQHTVKSSENPTTEFTLLIGTTVQSLGDTSAYAPANFESPYLDSANGTAVYPFNTGGVVADGKLYTYNTEHTASMAKNKRLGSYTA